MADNPSVHRRFEHEAYPLLRYAKDRSPTRFWIAVAALTLGIGLEGVSVFLLIPLFGFLAARNTDISQPIILSLPDWLWNRDLAFTLHEILIFFVFLIILASAINRAKTLFISSIVLDTTKMIRIDLFDAISRAKWGFISSKRKTDIEYLLNGSIEKLQGAMSAAFSLVQNVIALMLYTSISIAVSPMTTLAAFLSGIILFLLSSNARKLSVQFGKRHIELSKDQLRFTSNFVHGLKLVKSNSAEPIFRRIANDAFEKADKEYKLYISRVTLSSLIVQSLNIIFAVLVLYVALVYVRLSIEYVIFLFVIFLRINPRFSSLQSNFEQLLADSPVFLDIRSLERECISRAEPSHNTSADDLNIFEGDIKLESISLVRGGVFVLRDVSLRIRRNDLTVICGDSGSGKTTVADVVMGLLEPQSGAVYVGDQILSVDNMKIWRDNISYVPQQSFLLSATVRENLAFGTSGATDEHIYISLDRSNARALVDSMPHGLDTLVGDGGTQISGGELQRLALARALVRSPGLLILDEVTSGLDSGNRDLILDSLFRLRQEMTILMITHDEEIVRRAPNIIELVNGRSTNNTDLNDRS